MIVAIYVRVSTRKQDETNQLPRLREIAKNRGFEVYHEYSDEASAKDANRPGWRGLMEDASKHRFDTILVTKLDRVMRSLVQLNITMSNLQTYNVKLICADIWEIDYSSPMGKVQMQIIGAIAEWEREIIIQRTKEGIEAKKAKGIKLGRKKRDDIPIETIVTLRIAGNSWKSISQDLHIPKPLSSAEKRRSKTSFFQGPKRRYYNEAGPKWRGSKPRWEIYKERRGPQPFGFGPGEALVCAIALGYGTTQGESHPIKRPDEVSKCGTGVPEWFAKGVECALLAPTALMKQNFMFEYRDRKVYATSKGICAPVNLGIVKYHFEVGAGKDNVVWG